MTVARLQAEAEARQPGAADHDHRRALRARGLDDRLGDVGAGHDEDLGAQLAGEGEVGLEAALVLVAQGGARVDVDGRPVGPEGVGGPPGPAREVGRAGGGPDRDEDALAEARPEGACDEARSRRGRRR